MADEATEVATEPVAAVDPTPEPETPVAPAPDPVAELRVEKARLEGELAALRAQAAAQPAPQPAAQWTPQSIRAAYDAGQITDDQRVALLADLQAEARFNQWDATRRVQDVETQSSATLQQYIRAYPALNDPNSDLMRQVAAELRQMQQFEGANPRSLTAQVRAVKSIVGALRPDAASTARRGIPVGSGGIPSGGAPANPAHTGDPLKDIPKPVVDEWSRRGWLKTDEDKRFYAQRYRSRARTA